jgi:hypothetical protein
MLLFPFLLLKISVKVYLSLFVFSWGQVEQATRYVLFSASLGTMMGGALKVSAFS